MAIPFAYSLQSLRTDRMQPNIAGMSIAIVLLCMWALWFFFAPITLYENGQLVGMTRSGALLVQFPAAAAPKIAQGQSVRIQLPGGSAQYPLIITGIIAAITQYDADGGIQATLLIELPPDATENMKNAVTMGSNVEVAVVQVSPAILVARAAGLSVANAHALHLLHLFMQVHRYK